MYNRDDKLEVWLIEDDDLFRGTILELIDTEPTLRAIPFSSCEPALEVLDNDFVPGIVLMDIGLPGIDGIEGARRIKAISPTTQLIMLTVHEDDEKVFEAICAGASGYLLKSASADEILRAIEEARTGGAPMNPYIARKVLDRFTELSPQKHSYGLRPRERQILHLLVEGHTKKQIAERLFLSFSTVDSHLRNIYIKLQVHSRSRAVAKALRERLI